MELRFSSEDEAFRREARGWLTERLAGDFAVVRGRGGPGDEHELLRRAARVGAGARAPPAGSASAWPTEYGGRALAHPAGHLLRGVRPRPRPRAGRDRRGRPARADAHPVRHATSRSAASSPGSSPAPRSGARATPSPTRAPTWPTSQTAGRARRRRRVGHRRPEGLDVARALGRLVLRARAAPTATRPATGASRTSSSRWASPGVEIRPIVQITGTSEFNEVFFDGARTAGGQRRRRGERRLEGRDGHARVRARRARRSASSSASRTSSREILETAPQAGRADDPILRQRLADAWIALRIMRFNALRSPHRARAGELTPRRASTSSTGRSLHRGLGELAVDVLGADAASPTPRRTSSAASSACSSTAAPTPSTAGRTRSSAT